MTAQDVKSSDTFESKLAALRARIDRLPPEQRPHLYDLADAIARQRREMEQMKGLVHGAG